ncbi:MAG: YihY family inner membrane protein [Limnobacter sp.]|nr:YihY family inner membrane protein [Limnobacter sp.]
MMGQLTTVIVTTRMHLAPHNSQNEPDSHNEPATAELQPQRHKLGGRVLARAQRALNTDAAALKPTMPRWWLAFARLLAKRLVEQQLTQVAASLTFTTVLSLVPMMTVALAILRHFRFSKKCSSSCKSYLFEGFLPPSLSDSILGYVNQFSDKAKGLTAIGTVFWW